MKSETSSYLHIYVWCVSLMIAYLIMYGYCLICIVFDVSNIVYHVEIKHMIIVLLAAIIKSDYAHSIYQRFVLLKFYKSFLNSSHFPWQGRVLWKISHIHCWPYIIYAWIHAVFGNGYKQSYNKLSHSRQCTVSIRF